MNGQCVCDEGYIGEDCSEGKNDTSGLNGFHVLDARCVLYKEIQNDVISFHSQNSLIHFK